MKEATNILNQCRKRLVSWLKEGHTREYANIIVITWLKDQNNILSPYAEDVIPKIHISEAEIKWRKEFGDDFVDAYAKVRNALKK